MLCQDVESHNTKMFSFDAGTDRHVWIYYTKTIVNFKKGGSIPFWLYYTVHIDKEGFDLHTYPERYVGMYMAAYGVRGIHSDVNSGVYDAHKAFEIDKTKMKMLVPLDMNGKNISNFKKLSMFIFIRTTFLFEINMIMNMMMV